VTPFNVTPFNVGRSRQWLLIVKFVLSVLALSFASAAFPQALCNEVQVLPRQLFRPTPEEACTAYVNEINSIQEQIYCGPQGGPYVYGKLLLTIVNPLYGNYGSVSHCQMRLTGPCTDLESLQPYSGRRVPCDIKISLTGPSATKVSTPGPAITQTATVTRNGTPEAGHAVRISLTGGGAAVSGTTDSSGKYSFSYVPPRNPVTAVVTATCSDCNNTATKSITVTGGDEICPAEPGSQVGNPINPSTARKVQTEVDYTDAAAHPLSLSRHYRSSADGPSAGLGGAWSHNYAGSISIAPADVASVSLGNGYSAYFQRDTPTSPWYTNPVNASNPDRLEQTGDTFTYTRDADNSRWTFTNTAPGVLPILNARLTSCTPGLSPSATAGR
jgi:Domain of unknown function (DUF6531)